MLHDSTIAKGKDVPVIKLSVGKKMNLIIMNKNIIEKTQPLKLSSFHKINQNFSHPFFISIKRKKKNVFLK